MFELAVAEASADSVRAALLSCYLDPTNGGIVIVGAPSPIPRLVWDNPHANGASACRDIGELSPETNTYATCLTIQIKV